MRVAPGSITATDDGRLVYVPDLTPRIVAASACPHYLTVTYVEATGRHDMCAGCIHNGPVRAYGQYGKSGPISNRPRTTQDPAGKGYLKRRADAR